MTEPSYLTSTRTSYDIVAAEYAKQIGNYLPEQPLDRALIGAFADFARTAAAGPIADLGCGPGHATAYLRDLGLTAFGIDLSPQMVEQARTAHPDLSFEVGSMTDLAMPDGSLGGIIAMNSIQFIPPEELPALFAGFHRALAPGGELMLAYVLRTELRHLDEWFGHAISLDAHRLPPEQVIESLGQAGLFVHARTVFEPDGITDTRQRIYLLARKPAEV